MNTLELLRVNARDGVRLPYPADDASIELLRGIAPIGSLAGGFVIEPSGFWEMGEIVYLTAVKKCGIIWLQLQKKSEMAV